MTETIKIGTWTVATDIETDMMNPETTVITDGNKACEEEKQNLNMKI